MGVGDMEGDTLMNALPLGERDRELEEVYDGEVEGERVGLGLAVPFPTLLVPLTVLRVVTHGEEEAEGVAGGLGLALAVGRPAPEAFE